MSTVPVPHTPPLVYRGDRYRLNYTAGTILTLLADYGTRPVTELCSVLAKTNVDAGVPGGPAGTQWTPPAPKQVRTFRKEHKAKPGKTPLPAPAPDPNIPNLADDDDTDAAPDVEYYDDLLREHCTYFDADEHRIATILQMLDYARLVNYTGLDADITDLGKAVVASMREIDSTAKTLADTRGELTATQRYLFGDDRDKDGTHKVPFTVLPINITEVVRTATPFYNEVDKDPSDLFAKLPASTYSTAVQHGSDSPGTTHDIDSGSIDSDDELPIRRSLHRHPTYRQFLWILHNDKNTFVLAMAGNTEEATRLVGNKSDLGSAKEVDANPVRQKIKRARAIAKQTAKFTAAVLSGGPEGVWVGKPLTARDVHSDVISFVAANRPGYNDVIARGSSLAWETFDTLRLNIGDFERARANLREGYGRGLIAQGSLPASNVSATSIIQSVDPPIRTTAVGAEKYVERTARQALIAMGIEGVESMPVIPGPDGLQAIMCQHTTAFRANGTGEEIIRQCNAQSLGVTGYCEKHGGSYLDAEEMQSLVRANSQKIVAAGSMATEVMIRIMLTSTNDAIQLRAAEQLLNRGGLGESRELNINIDDKTVMSPRDKIMGKLTRLSGSAEDTRAALEKKQAEQDNIIEGEVETTESR